MREDWWRWLYWMIEVGDSCINCCYSFSSVFSWEEMMRGLLSTDWLLGALEQMNFLRKRFFRFSFEFWFKMTFSWICLGVVLSSLCICCFSSSVKRFGLSPWSVIRSFLLWWSLSTFFYEMILSKCSTEAIDDAWQCLSVWWMLAYLRKFFKNSSSFTFPRPKLV